MNKFLLFAGSEYYPRGGAEDLKGNFSTIELSIRAGNFLKSDKWIQWIHVLDVETQEVTYILGNPEEDI